MASTSRTVKLSHDLADAIEIRARKLGYPSTGAYLKGLMRYDLMVQGHHDITKPYAHLRLDEQDELDTKLLGMTQSGVGVRGQWLEAIIEERFGPERLKEVKEKLADECRKKSKEA